MRNIIRLGMLAVAAVFVTACATTMAGSHVDADVDLRLFSTYDWGPRDALPIADPRLDDDPAFHDYVQGAVEKQLTACGLERASASRPPDVLIHYHATIATRMDVAGADREHGYCYGDDCATRVEWYEAGTLVIDIVDTRTQRVIWRGWARDRLGDALEKPHVLHDKIDAAVRGIFERFRDTAIAGGR
jgi:hypothetical protein